MTCNIQELSHCQCDVWMTELFMFCHLTSKGGSESLLCKEAIVVVACSRVVQNQADFSFQWQRVTVYRLFTISHHSTSTVLYWSCKLPVPTQRISQAASNHTLCLDCSHLDPRLCSELARTEAATACKDWSSKCVTQRAKDIQAQWNSDSVGHVSGLQTHCCLFLVKNCTLSGKTGVLHVPLLINSSSVLMLCKFPPCGGCLIYSCCVIDPFTGRQGRQDYAKLWRLVRDLNQTAIIFRVN